MSDKRVTMIRLEHIQIDRKLQARVRMDMEAAADYGLRYKQALPMPPIQVCEEAKHRYWLWDGFHRVEGCVLEKIKMVLAEIRPGTRRDALLLACGANCGHGVKRTREDMRRAVELLLSDAEWRKWNASEISRHCGVSQPFARLVKDEYEARILKRLRIETSPETGNKQLVTRKGTTYEQEKPPGPEPAQAVEQLTFIEKPPVEAPKRTGPEYETFLWTPPRVERAFDTIGDWLAKIGMAGGDEHLAALAKLCAVEKRRLKK